MSEILLVDAAGMSISMLSNKMDQYSAAHDLGYHVEGIDAAAEEHIAHVKPAIIMIAPQVSYLFDKYNDKYGADIPVVNIEMMAYGTMNAETIISAAIEKIG
ncbi:PTS cellobiose transporter subunit IIB [Leuconostoc sp. UCMA20149]|uniref:PTS cellobiose transporter subunit IIB n=1 Tax=Leuconostoc sp. UCMA20149 TaxID=2583528 RepID=UPI0025B10354|nr:PTS cellobiose transporter subunit IIB [Leuconostoc sp. UCMA20149]MDN2450496.1 PTS cellobiose transporter subunit IIB [Leuconostoc sp. UCMA20149]